jgi:hypothetical protein
MATPPRATYRRGVVRRLIVLLLLVPAGCGGGPPEADRAAPPDDTGGDGVAVPDGGVAAGHGADTARPALVRVPERDATPPLALLRLWPGAGARLVEHRSPVRARRSPPVTLSRPEVRATAVIRDPEGTGRIRITVKYVATCAGARLRRTVHHPPPEIERIRLAPGTDAPAVRTRRDRVPLPAGCRVAGEAFADATNALGLESFSDPVRFVYG